MNLNRNIFCGRITKDIELKVLPSGTKVCTISIATNRTWKNQNGEKQEDTTFIDIKAFGKQAEVIAQYCHKGDEIYTESRMVNANYEKEGQKIYRNDFILESFQFGAKNRNAPEKPQNARTDDFTEKMSIGTTEPSLDEIANELSLSDLPF